LPLKPGGYAMPHMLSVLCPSFHILSVRVAVCPTGTLPNARSPTRRMTRVAAPGAAFTVRENVFVEAWPPLPVTRTVKVAVVAVVGEPLMTPPPLSTRPGGRLPEERDHAYGVVPPLAASATPYATPRVPVGRGLAVVTVGAAGAALMVRLNAFVEDAPSLPVTRAVKAAVAAAPGVPMSTPPPVSARPDGRLPEAIDHV